MFQRIIQRVNLIPYILKLLDYMSASTPILSSVPFIPGKARARVCRVYLKTKLRQEGKEKIHRFINSIPSGALKNPRVVSAITDEFFQEFSYEELNDRLIPNITDRIEKMRNLNKRQKLYIYLMLGAHDSVKKYIGMIPNLRKPDFIIAGAQKSGTSWLMEAIGNHPEVWVTPTELHYFTSNRRRWTWEEYLALFSLNDKRITGEKSPTYLQVIDKVVDKLPETRVFVILRNPFERLVSQYFHDIGNDRFRERYKIGNIRDYVERNVGDCLERGLYYQNLKNSFSKINIMFFQDLVNNPGPFLSSVLSSLGLTNVSPDRLIPNRKINRANNRPEVSSIDFLKAEGLTKNLKEYYLDDISNLSRVTGRDLSEWTEW